MNKELKLKETLLRYMFVHLDKFGKAHYIKKKKESKIKETESTPPTPVEESPPNTEVQSD